MMVKKIPSVIYLSLNPHNPADIIVKNVEEIRRKTVLYAEETIEAITNNVYVTKFHHENPVASSLSIQKIRFDFSIKLTLKTPILIASDTIFPKIDF